MKIPTLLAGPIIRRVEQAQIHIWIATSSPFQIEAELYHISENEQDGPTEYGKINTLTRKETVHAGDHMYIHLLKVTPATNTFPTDTLLGYNLFFSTHQEQLDLSSFELLSPENPQSIVYGNLKYPTFFIQQNSRNNILYGSCRKPHGKGNDVMTSVDLTINNQPLNLNERPSNLFLMGDQIYADDVADPLFHVLSAWARRLTGKNTEQLVEIDERLAQEPFPTAIDQVHGRQYITEYFCKFTSGNAANHLMRFSEYAAMYLMTLGPALWENSPEDNQIPSLEKLVENGEVYFMYPDQEQYEKERAKELKQHRKRYEEQVKELLPLIKTLPRVRRVLANTPTYMIFDDHDITDDWNISADWKENVRHAPLGKHVIGNGLAAYWLFQGWGNDPDAFDVTFRKNMAHYFQTFPSPESPLYEQWINQLWQFQSWHFIAPTNPTSLFLDTRTLRGYDFTPLPVRVAGKMAEGKHAAALISTEGWEIISSDLEKSSWNQGDPLAIISPTPLYGIVIVESFLYRCVYPFRILGIPIRYELDFEAWKYNGNGFNHFLQQIAVWNPSQCFILSGDVHYANAVQSRVKFYDKRKITINQFTSSPINNMSFSGIWGMLMKITVWFNSLKRKQRVLYRCCDEENNLNLEKKNNADDDTFKWREEIQYLSSDGGSIIETNNNIGLLTLDDEFVENKLLKYDGQHETEVNYEPTILKQLPANN